MRDRLAKLLTRLSTLSIAKLRQIAAVPLTALDVFRPSIARELRHRAGSWGPRCWRLGAEAFWLALAHGIDPDLYLRAGLHRGEIGWPKKLEFLGDRAYLRLMERVNPPRQRMLANKYVSAALFERFGIPAPRTYACLGAGGLGLDGSSIERPRDLERLVRDHDIGGACLKTIGGFGGYGFTRLEFKHEADGIVCAIGSHGQSLDLETCWERLQLGTGAPRLLQELVDQHPDVAALHPSSLNTLRVWTERAPARGWRMVSGAMRMGAGGRLVDGSSHGGVISPVDLHTGALGVAVALMAHSFDAPRYERHPTTGEPIQGRVLPFWEDMPAFCSRMSLPFSPGLRLMGLDIAFGRSGLLAIEVNARPSAKQQIVDGIGVRPTVERALAQPSGF